MLVQYQEMLNFRRDSVQLVNGRVLLFDYSGLESVQPYGIEKLRDEVYTDFR